jgi:hypothetical protein
MKMKTDLIAVTFVKCGKNEAINFQTTFANEFLGKEWPGGEADCDGVIPVFVATTTGYFDYIVGIKASSARVVTDFLAKVMRSDDNDLGKTILDTQTTIAALSQEGIVSEPPSAKHALSEC